MKKKSITESEKMTPRELARYAVVDLILSTTAILSEDKEKQVDLLERSRESFYKKYLRNLDGDNYVVYLEQLVKEIDFYFSTFLTDSYLPMIEKLSNNSGGSNSKYTDEPRFFEFLTKGQIGLFVK